MNRRLALVGGLFLVLVVALAIVPPSNQRQPPLTVYSAEPGGGKALRLWLETLGHPVSILEGGRYAVGQDVGVVLLLSPTRLVGDREAGELERWTRRGGRLVVASDSFQTWELLRQFDVAPRIGSQSVRAVPATGGVLDPAIEQLPVDTRAAVDPGEKHPGAVPLLYGLRADEEHVPGADPSVGADGRDRPILAARIPVERGELIVLTAPELLSNEGLRAEPNARLALSLVGENRRARVAFDEVHHSYGAIPQGSFFTLLLEQAWGRASLLAGGVVLLFLFWRGRRFGRSVPVFVDRGRSIGELVTSQAGLYRAGGKRAFMAEHLSRQLRHDLAQTVGLPGSATDAEIAARAAAIGRDPSQALQAVAGTWHARSDRELLANARAGASAVAELRGQAAPAASGATATRSTPPLRAGEGVGG